MQHIGSLSKHCVYHPNKQNMCFCHKLMENPEGMAGFRTNTSKHGPGRQHPQPCQQATANAVPSPFFDMEEVGLITTKVITSPT